MNNEITIRCSCRHAEHTLLIASLIGEDGESWFGDVAEFQPVLSSRPFWSRLVNGVRYIFGWKSDYGLFDCVVITKDQAIEIIALLTEAVENCKHEIGVHK